MGWVLNNFANIAAWLKSFEQQLNSIDSADCVKSMTSTANMWQNFWKTYGVIPSSAWGIGLGNYSSDKRFFLDATDISNIGNYYGIKLSCRNVAAAANTLIAGRGCCYKVTCDKTSSITGLEIPAGIELNNVFK